MNAPTFEEVKTRMKQLIVNDLEINIDPQSIDDEASLYDDGLGLDSIAIINFIVLIENNFGISFMEDEIGSRLFSNINTLAGFVTAKMSAQLNGMPS